MSTQDEAGRRRLFACPRRTSEIQGIELAYLDLDDPDDRRLPTLADHPELQALSVSAMTMACSLESEPPLTRQDDW
jgi:hypothetical protein